MLNILILYSINHEYPVRTTIADHLYAFQRYTSHHCTYVNLAVRPLPKYVQKFPWDMIVFHTSFLAARWGKRRFEKILQKARALKNVDAVKVALPQDEFVHTDVLCDFFNEFGIDWVFSVSPESEWSKIYPSIDFQKIKFYKILTGYLDDQTIKRINELKRSISDRPIDIGYRAWRAEPWLGRHGFLKTEIAELFNEEAPKKGLVTDISTRAADTFLGDDWYRFLLQCKSTIGVEGGATVLDRDGMILQRTREYVALHPQASFQEIEAACFPNKDGYLQLFAISPRHLEACVTRTCQVLVEGSYNGILIAGQHYIELKRDFSNIDQVLALIKQDHLREIVTTRAYNDIVESDAYTYRGLVQTILTQALAKVDMHPPTLMVWISRVWGRLADWFSWQLVAFFVLIYSPLRRLIRRVSVSLPSKEFS